MQILEYIKKLIFKNIYLEKILLKVKGILQKKLKDNEFKF